MLRSFSKLSIPVGSEIVGSIYDLTNSIYSKIYLLWWFMNSRTNNDLNKRFVRIVTKKRLDDLQNFWFCPTFIIMIKQLLWSLLDSFIKRKIFTINKLQNCKISHWLNVNFFSIKKMWKLWDSLLLFKHEICHLIID